MASITAGVSKTISIIKVLHNCIASEGMHNGISSTIEVCVACGPRNLFRKEVRAPKLVIQFGPNCY